ncbi:hypothetical protein [Streptomyces sp. 6-11-2]|uniref:ISAzo13-like element transposase-related protein n=1 Tax=Streptomyces sp. 6-11-2 TaxID=2585753 RepID=UPI00114319F0
MRCLQAGANTIEGKQHPEGDTPFRYINELARQHTGAGQPVISVDAFPDDLTPRRTAAWRGAVLVDYV